MPSNVNIAEILRTPEWERQGAEFAKTLRRLLETYRKRPWTYHLGNTPVSEQQSLEQDYWQEPSFYERLVKTTELAEAAGIPHPYEAAGMPRKTPLWPMWTWRSVFPRS